jgi:hypothetical protein
MDGPTSYTHFWLPNRTQYYGEITETTILAHTDYVLVSEIMGKK